MSAQDLHCSFMPLAAQRFWRDEQHMDLFGLNVDAGLPPLPRDERRRFGAGQNLGVWQTAVVSGTAERARQMGQLMHVSALLARIMRVA